MSSWRRSRRRREPLVELVYQKRSLARGPHIVAIGGGTGLSTLLRGLKEVTSNITAVVTVADDGGSSGKLRQELGVPPMGDIRNCIAALADAEPTMTSLMQYRFPATEGEPGLAGHAFGNLLIAAMVDISGDFEEGVRLANRVLAVRGRVVPVAPQALNLLAELADGSHLEGQSRIMRSRGIRRVWLSPATVEASAEAVEAIRAADLIVIGPGWLYTSVLPSLLVPGIRSAIEGARGLRVYVGNVATQPGETEGYTLSRACRGPGRARRRPPHRHRARQRRPTRSRARGVPGAARAHRPARAVDRAAIVLAGVVDPANAHRHDPVRLTDALLAPARGAAPRPDPWRTCAALEADTVSPTRDRDLVEAVRAELAAIDPPRACCRAPSGWARRGRARPGALPVVARLAVRLADDAAGGAVPRALFDWASGALPLPLGLAARPLPVRGVAEPRGHGAHLELVVPPGEATSWRVTSTRPGSRLAAVRRGRGVLTWKRTRRCSRSCAPAAPVPACSRSSRASSRASSTATSIASSTPRQPTSSAASPRASASWPSSSGSRRAAGSRTCHAVERAVAHERRAAPEATFSELAARLGFSRARVQRAFERLESAAARREASAADL